MDKEYIRNIVGSPYVNEGAFQRLKSKAAQAMGGFNAMAGYGVENPTVTQLKSLWGGFANKITSLLKDIKYNFPVSQATPEQKDLYNKISDLYYDFAPSQPTLKGLQPVRNSWSNPSVTKAKDTYPVTTSQPGSSLKEATRDIFTRDMDLNKAWYSRDLNTILTAYKNKIQSLYNAFLSDASKVTRSPKETVVNTLSNINPKYKTAVDKLQSLTAEPVVAPQVTDPTTVSTPPAAAIAPTTPPTTPTTGGTIAQSKMINMGADDFAKVVLHVMNMITDVVTSDFDYINPKEFNTNAPITEANDPADEPMGVPKSNDTNPFDELPGEFLYNFQGRYDKQRNFAIEIKSTKVGDVIPLSKGSIKVKVYWINRQHENLIQLHYTTTGNVRDKIKLFVFYDKDVDPTTPSFSGNTSVLTYLRKANPYEQQLLTKSNPSLLTEIKKLENDFNKSLYTTVKRKSMEFKSRTKPIFINQVTPEGNVVLKDGSIYTQSEIKQFIYDKYLIGQLKWRNALILADYYKSFPNMIPIDPDKDIYDDTVKALMHVGYAKVDAENETKHAWDALILSGKSSNDISQPLMFKYIQLNDPKFDKKIKPSVAPTTPSTTPAPAPTTPPTTLGNIIPSPTDPTKSYIIEPNGDLVIFPTNDPSKTKILDKIVVKNALNNINIPGKNGDFAKKLDHELLNIGYYDKFPDMKPQEPSVSTPEPVQTPSEPVQVSPEPTPTTPAEKPSEPAPIEKLPRVSIDDSGIITVAGYAKKYKIGQFIPTKIRMAIKNDPAMQNKYDKFQKKMKEMVNPFQAVNFL